MIEIICKYCKTIFNAKRKNRIICESKECQLKASNERVKKHLKRNPNKYNIYLLNNDKRDIRNQRQKQYYGDNINDAKYKYDSNSNCNTHICEECGFEYYSHYQIEPIYRHSILLEERTYIKQNVTEWGAGVCPQCGLVEKSIIDTDPWAYYLKYQPHSANQDEYNEWKRDLRRIKIPPILKKYAIYLDKQKTTIDFLQEFIALRMMLNRLKEKKEKKEITILTTPDEEQTCFRALNAKLLKNKVINK